METIIPFLFKSIISSAILLSYYWIVLRDKNFHQFNRYYLIATLLLSLVTPVIHFAWYDLDASISPTAINLITSLDSNQVTLSGYESNWKTIFVICWIVISLTSFSILSANIICIYRIKNQCTIVKMKGFNLIETDLPQAPFTFFNNLFWLRHISLDSVQGMQIYTHQLIHISDRHSIDDFFA